MATPNYMLSGLERELELYMGEEYESGSPNNVYEKILAKVHYIKDSGLTRKPLQNTPVEITFDYDFRRKRLTVSARQLDIHYVYDVKDIHRLKGNSSGTIVWGESTNASRYGYMKLEIGQMPYLTFRAFRSAPPIYGSVLKDDGYTLENEQEAQKLRNMFLALLKAGEIAPLDQELEFELDDEEFESDDFEDNDEFEYEYDYEDDEEFGEDEFELDDELNTLENEAVTENFANRLHELSAQSFESEYELEMELDNALEAMENEFMVKRLQRKKKRGKRKGLFKKILSTGAKIVGKVAGKTPIGSLIKAGTSLVRGNIKGALGNLAKAAVGTALGPVAGTVATTAIDALSGGDEGGEEGEIRRGGRRRRAMRRVARIARDAYREGADTLPDNFDHPLVAHEVARNAVRKAMVKNGVRPPGKAAGASQQRRVIQLKPGEKVVIVRS